MKSPGTRFRSPVFIAVVGLAWLLAACGGTTAQPAATPSPTPKPDVEFKSVGTQGMILVASSNGMTVYTFTMDVANSGKSNCKAACLTRWPALTVPTGQTPVGGSGVTQSSLGSIVRDDNQMTQVTIKGLPLYFFSMDTAPGDTKGIYPNWLVVKQTG